MVLIWRAEDHTLTPDNVSGLAGAFVDVPGNTAAGFDLCQQRVGVMVASGALKDLDHDARDSRMSLPGNILRLDEMQHIHCIYLLRGQSWSKRAKVKACVAPILLLMP